MSKLEEKFAAYQDRKRNVLELMKLEVHFEQQSKALAVEREQNRRKLAAAVSQLIDTANEVGPLMSSELHGVLGPLKKSPEMNALVKDEAEKEAPAPAPSDVSSTSDASPAAAPLPDAPLPELQEAPASA